MADGSGDDAAYKPPKPPTLDKEGDTAQSPTGDGGGRSLFVDTMSGGAKGQNSGSQPEKSPAAPKELARAQVAIYSGTENLTASTAELDDKKGKHRPPPDSLPDDGIPENPGEGPGSASDAIGNQSNETFNVKIVCVSKELDEAGKKKAIEISQRMGYWIDPREINVDLTVNPKGDYFWNDKKTFNPKSGELQVWASPWLKDHPAELKAGLEHLRGKLAEQHPHVILDTTNIPDLWPEPVKPGPDDDKDEDGKPIPPDKDKDKVVPSVIPVTPSTGPAALTDMAKKLAGVPFKTTAGVDDHVFMNPYTFTSFAAKAMPTNIGTLLVAAVRQGQLDNLPAHIEAYKAANANDFLQLKANVANLSRPLTDPTVGDTVDAAVLNDYFVDRLTNPSRDPAFVRNLALALDKHARALDGDPSQKMTETDIKTFFSDEKLRISLAAATVADVATSPATRADLKSLDFAKQQQFNESLISKTHRFEFLP